MALWPQRSATAPAPEVTALDLGSFEPNTRKFLFGCAFWVAAADEELRSGEQVWLSQQFGEDTATTFLEEFLSKESEDLERTIKECATGLLPGERARIMASIEEWLGDCAAADGSVGDEEQAIIEMIVEQIRGEEEPAEEQEPVAPQIVAQELASREKIANEKQKKAVSSPRPRKAAVVTAALAKKILALLAFLAVGGLIFYWGMNVFGMPHSSSVAIFRIIMIGFIPIPIPLGLFTTPHFWGGLLCLIGLCVAGAGIAFMAKD